MSLKLVCFGDKKEGKMTNIEDETLGDFWPSTGLFINMKTKKRGRGVFKLLNLIEVGK